MSSLVTRMAREFVDEWSLHEGGVPVDLGPLEDHFVPHYSDLSEQGVVGYGLFVDELGSIFIDEQLSDYERRLVYAHELGHYIAGHSASPVTSQLDDVQHSRDEREAWLVAAVLLIPPEAVEWDTSASDVAGSCRVPEWLVEMYYSMLVARGV